MAGAGQPSEQFDWQYYLSHSDAGRAWLAEFHQPRHAEIADRADQALKLLHRRQAAPARELLRAVEASLGKLPDSRPSIVHVLGRRYHGVLAYHDYATQRFTSATGELIAAADCIRRAISSDPVLLALAIDCTEFHLHHARIARNQGRWAEMQVSIDTARDMLYGKQPLCALDDGTVVSIDTIVQQYHEMALPPEAQARLAPMFEPALRRDAFERFIMTIYLRPGFVVPC